MPNRLLIACAFALGVAAAAQARQLPPPPPQLSAEERLRLQWFHVKDGDPLPRGGPFYQAVEIVNECEWEQDVQPLGTGWLWTVGGGETITEYLPLSESDTHWNLRVNLEHKETRDELLRTCEFATLKMNARFVKTATSPYYPMPSTGQLSPLRLVLKQRGALEPPSGAGPPTAPKPAPDDVDVGASLDYPAIPIPSKPVDPDDIDPDDVFGGGTVGGACTGGGCFDLGDCTGGSCGVTPPLIPEPKGGLDLRSQIMGGEWNTALNQSTFAPIQLPAPQLEARRLNPLGLLARSMREFLEWWSPTVHAAEALTLEQAAKLPGGVQFLITSLGGSTGKNLSMQVLNFTGKPVSLQGILALEPLKSDAQQRVTQAFSKLAGRAVPAKVDLRGYCFEFLKLPPVAGQLMTVAAPEVQKRFAPLKRVMTAANQLQAAGRLRPDSNPESYGDSIKQWAIWTVEQRFNQAGFAEAFLGHTKKNVEAAGQKWSKQIEDVVRQRTPNRWQDVVAILQGAGAAVPK